MPDPFGMRWFGIFGGVLVFGVVLQFMLPSPFGALLYMLLVVVSAVVLIILSQRGAARRWLLGRWL